jgi:RHS repeat-associated protein
MASSRNSSLAFGQSTTYASSSVNAYTSISGGGFQAPSPTYDPNGNTLTLPRPNGSSQALTWDAFDRLRSASNTQSQISKVYDPLGRLVWIRSIQSGQTAKDEIWSWTGWTLLTREVRQGSTTLDTFRYIWGPDLSTTLEGAGGVGGLLAIEHAPGNSTTWDIRYVHYDANGNVIALTDSSGSTSARYRYSPFGELIASEDLDNSGWNDRNIHRFSTKPEVTGTGLLYYGYRYYDPKTGRWPSRDPIEEEGGINLYGFVGNDGVNKWDLLGNSVKLPPGLGNYWGTQAGVGIIGAIADVYFSRKACDRLRERIEKDPCAKCGDGTTIEAKLVLDRFTGLLLNPFVQPFAEGAEYYTTFWLDENCNCKSEKGWHQPGGGGVA